MTSRLPPLIWLRAFEAAGRHSSFKRAAEELHVTPSTVSHQVRDLENWLQTPLFERITRAVRLTAAGEQYLQEVSGAFQIIAQATERLKPEKQRTRLKIGMFPSFASEVVVPRIAELQALLPDVELVIDSNTQLGALTSEDETQRCDALIRYGKGEFPGCIGRLLTEIRIAPMCTPAYLKKHLISCAEDLNNVTLIKVSGPFDGWHYWAKQTGIETPTGRDRLVLDNYLSAMHAVKQGLGVGSWYLTAQPILA